MGRISSLFPGVIETIISLVKGTYTRKVMSVVGAMWNYIRRVPRTKDDLEDKTFANWLQQVKNLSLRKRSTFGFGG